MSFYRQHFILKTFIFSFIFGLIWGFFFLPEVKSIDLPTSVHVAITLCGNNIKEIGEECDGTDLDSQTCMTKGFSGGILSCNPNCASFDTSSCTSGRRGGGGFQVLPLADTKVIFQGRAYPASIVTLMKDAQIAVSTVAGPDANFQITLSNLSAGTYIFSLYAHDNQGRRSTVQTFPITITSGATTTISGIFIAPTISLDKSVVKKGDNLTIFGQSASNAEISIAVSSETESFFKANSDKNGIYLYNLDSSFLDLGDHSVKSKTAANGLISSFGKIVTFKVGNRNVLNVTDRCDLKGDFDNNCRINLIDFSIMAYWYKRPPPPSYIDLNNNGNINIFDFSILAYYWTG